MSSNDRSAFEKDDALMEFGKHPGNSDDVLFAGDQLDEIVFGLRWDSPEGRHGAKPVDLDAVCVLLDERLNTLQVIHAAHPRTEDDSVIHTGDSSAGASAWDDERIFVFLQMLPANVSWLVFFVMRATADALLEPRGAFCHISDRISEKVWAKFDLPSLSESSIHSVATLSRGENGWRITTRTPFLNKDVYLRLSRLRSSLV